MVWQRREHKNLFWTGFFSGAVVGGAVGLFLASGVGRRAYQQLETAAQEARSRLNGRLTPDGEGAAQPAPETDSYEAAESAPEEDVENPT